MRRGLLAIALGSIAINAALLTGFLPSAANVLSRGSHPLLSQRIFVEHPNDIVINFTDLRTELRAFVEQPRDFRAGVYFEYLPSGVSIGVNEKEEFLSASLLKVPFIMGVVKKMESGDLKENNILTVKSSDLDSAFGTLWKEGAGAQLTVWEAVQKALRESDNTAVRVLNRSMTHDVVREVHEALDIPVTLNNNLPVVSPKNYSSIFRCLYLSCFLSYDGSQHVLYELTQSIFMNGIRTGVPEEIAVAHKIGVYDRPEHDGGTRSDCGIVYEPKRPYILCIVTDGDATQEQNMIDFMHTISANAYRFVHNM